MTGTRYTSVQASPRGILLTAPDAGEVYLLDAKGGNASSVVARLDAGQVSGACYDNEGASLYVADLALASVLMVVESEESKEGKSKEGLRGAALRELGRFLEAHGIDVKNDAFCGLRRTSKLVPVSTSDTEQLATPRCCRRRAHRELCVALCVRLQAGCACDNGTFDSRALSILVNNAY